MLNSISLSMFSLLPMIAASLSIAWSFILAVEAARILEQLEGKTGQQVLLLLGLALSGVAFWYEGLLSELTLATVTICCVTPFRTRISFITAMILCLWFAAIPIHTNANKWLESREGQVLLAIAQGSLPSLADADSLAIANPYVAYVVGHYDRQAGLYKEAERALVLASDHAALAVRTQQELAVVYHLNGNTQRAKKIYEDLESQHVSNAVFWFNYSKLSFHLGDRARSSEQAMQAQKMDPNSVQQLLDAEEALGLGDPKTFAWSALTSWDIRHLLMSPFPGDVYSDIEKQARSIFPFGGLLGIGALSGLVLLISTVCFLRGSPSQPASSSRSLILNGILTLTPGGYWLLKAEYVKALIVAAEVWFVVLLAANSNAHLKLEPTQLQLVFALWATALITVWVYNMKKLKLKRQVAVGASLVSGLSSVILIVANSFLVYRWIPLAFNAM